MRPERLYLTDILQAADAIERFLMAQSLPGRPRAVI